MDDCQNHQILTSKLSNCITKPPGDNMDCVRVPFEVFKSSVNGFFVNKEPWQVSTISVTSALLAVWLYDFLCQDESITTRTKKAFFKYAKKIPHIKAKIDSELLTVREGFTKAVVGRNKDLPYIVTLPKEKMSKEEILRVLKSYLELSEYDANNSQVSGALYYKSEELADIVKEVYGLTSYTNPLHSDVFPGLCKIESEVIQMALKLFHAGDDGCGTMTTGGTESILMACKAYRDYALETKGIKRPEMLVPITGHCAFDKAAQYFKIRIRYIPVDPETTQVDIKAMRRAISSNTIMLVGSFPNFPYGTMDDIQAISELGVRYNIPVHVDSCLGGFLTAFMPKCGLDIKICDFRLPGVTSISADTHKYGFAPKGTSLVMYKEKKYLHYQYTATSGWPGGVYASPTVNGSRNGGSIATCWATMLSLGEDTYISKTRDIIRTRETIEAGLRKMDGIYVIGTPVTSVVAVGSKVFDIFRLLGVLNEKGWSLNILQFPSGFHFCITEMHINNGTDAAFLRDVGDALKEILKDPGLPTEGRMAVYGYSQKIPDRSIVDEIAMEFLDALQYIPSSKKK